MKLLAKCMIIFSKLFTVVLIFSFSLNVFATAQAPDKIIYNGKEYKLHSNPMETYFKQYPDKRPKDGIKSTALWRGYVATYEIKDNQLFLKDIEILICEGKRCRNTKWKSVLKEIFPNQEFIKIDWMTGILVLSYGKMVNYVHMGYGSTYENYILLELEKGNLKQEKQLSNKEYEKYKERQFLQFKKTDEYKEIKENLPYNDDEFIDSFLLIYDINHSSKILDE